jgi:hypothetical protein
MVKPLTLDMTITKTINHGIPHTPQGIRHCPLFPGRRMSREFSRPGHPGAIGIFSTPRDPINYQEV